MSTPGVDVLHAGICVIYNLGPEEAKILAHWTYYAAGMDPVTTVIFERPLPWCVPEERLTEATVERRIAVIQGAKVLLDTPIDYMEGYE